MTWNWQLQDWSKFGWDEARLAVVEQYFLVAGGVLVGMAKHLDPEEHDQLTIEAMSMEGLTISEIEGEMLDRASVQSSIRKQLRLATDTRRMGPAE